MRSIVSSWRFAARGQTSSQSCRRAFASIHSQRTPGRRVSIRADAIIRWEQRRHVFAAASRTSTIYALSTAPGRAAIAVIRVSGPACLDIYSQLCPEKPLPAPKVAAVRVLYDPAGPADREHILDSSALVLYFRGPKSVTGEDVLELHVHGGPAVVKAVLSAIARCRAPDEHASISYAEAGEFTRRAFFNNRLDLMQVEALGDTLTAATEQQRRLAVRGSSGELAKRYEKWREDLLSARGELEALIDFSEDQHFDESPTQLCESVAVQIARLIQKLRVYHQNAIRGELLRHGISISLLGAPNAGKSSLLNQIVGREAAIVSSQAGTTRDVVEVGVDLGGYFCRFGDTAGLRQSTRANSSFDQVGLNVVGEIESEGMRRAKARAAESDVVIVVVSLERADVNGGMAGFELDREVVDTANQLLDANGNVVVVLNKADAETNPDTIDSARAEILKNFIGLRHDRLAVISCRDALAKESQFTDPGKIQEFLHVLVRVFAEMTSAASLAASGEEGEERESEEDRSMWEESVGASERHRVLLEETIAHLKAFMQEVSPSSAQSSLTRVDSLDWGREPDLVVGAEHLRGAADCLARITGRGEAGDVEDVLGVVFEKFCVGK